MSADIVFMDPPIRYDWASIADTVRSSPGSWVLVFTDGLHSTANSLRYGHNRQLSPEEFEFRTSNNKPGPPRTCNLYARTKEGGPWPRSSSSTHPRR